MRASRSIFPPPHGLDPIVVVSNMAGMQARSSGGERTKIVPAAPGLGRFVKQIAGADLVILDEAGVHLGAACILKSVYGFRLVCADLVFQKPRDRASRMKAWIWRRLLARVDLFCFYFKNTAGLQRHFGIDPARIAFVPFKVNEELVAQGERADGDYVLCAGRSRRDTGTFIEAMRRVAVPGIIVQQDRQLLSAHGTTAVDENDLPANVRLVIDRDNDLPSLIAKSRILIVPRFAGDMNATGISLYLAAMALAKPVIISRGPGADDILKDQAVFVEPENHAELAAAIASLYANAELRSELGERGRAYAASLGNDVRLLDDILDLGMQCVRERTRG